VKQSVYSYGSFDGWMLSDKVIDREILMTENLSFHFPAFLHLQPFLFVLTTNSNAQKV